ncbi:MAG: peptidoglycan-binding protein, partial [Congregibacter sp.]|nr:peptidoglycan-binding protein [Congregibacter sp.]
RDHFAGMPAGRELFSAGLVRAIYRESRGVPRLINLLCDRMLLGAYGRNSDRLDRDLLKQAVREVLGGAAARGRWQNSWLRSSVMVPLLLVMAVLAIGIALNRSLWTAEPSASAGSAPESRVQAAAESSAAISGALVAPDAPEQPPFAAAPAMRDWRLSPLEGAQRLLALYGAADPMSENPCLKSLGPDLRCEARQLQSWNQLLSEGRPALLGLLDERRFESRALLLAIADDVAVLHGPGGVQRVLLQELASQWTGTVWQLWRPSPGVIRTLEMGDAGEDVARVARLFARLDGQSEPLTESVFDGRLEQRVTLFQQQQGLRPDGVLGENTLRALSLAVGDDLGFAEALAWARAQIEPAPSQQTPLQDQDVEGS